jgi:hypothetical protein
MAIFVLFAHMAFTRAMAMLHAYFSLRFVAVYVLTYLVLAIVRHADVLHRQVTCGKCLIRHETPIQITKLRCHRHDHVSSGRQKVRELFGIDSQNCLICWDKLVDRTSTPCGRFM